MTTTTTTTRRLINAVLVEMDSRMPGTAIDIPSLVQDHGRVVFSALRILAAEKMVRLIPVSGDLFGWMDERGYTDGQEYRANGKVFVQVARA